MQNERHRRTTSVPPIVGGRWRAGIVCMLMFTAATTACSQRVQKPGQPMDQLPAAARLLLTQSATVGEPERRIVDDQAEWATLWASLHAGLSAPPLPAVDFAREVVAFATMGTRPTGGFAVDISGTRRIGDSLEVVLIETVPAADCMLTQAESGPTVAARVPRARGAIRFMVRQKTEPC